MAVSVQFKIAFGDGGRWYAGVTVNTPQTIPTKISNQNLLPKPPTKTSHENLPRKPPTKTSHLKALSHMTTKRTIADVEPFVADLAGLTEEKEGFIHPPPRSFHVPRPPPPSPVPCAPDEPFDGPPRAPPPEEAQGTSMVKHWSFHKNAVATALVKVALYTPAWLWCVDEWQKKLYTTLTRTVWIQETTRRYTMLNMRAAKELISFLDSMTGGKACQNHKDGAYLTVADTTENEMHLVMRGLGFFSVPYPETADAFGTLHAKYPEGTHSTIASLSLEEEDHKVEKFWTDAVRLWHRL